ncbi:MAG: hypothetical protein FJY20_11425 [Bacteroidetes bacterium]|nr:hypothetical protein [Bacteroidota bacterium]
MKRLLFILQIGLFIAMNFFLLQAIYEIAVPLQAAHNSSKGSPQYNSDEEYDPSLNRLNSVSAFMAYCDSQYAVTAAAGQGIFEKQYPKLVQEVVRKRFYHGYSHYGPGNNHLASLVSKFTISGLSAIVIPDDILKFPYAACSQQSLVLMKVLQKKGFKTRKIALSGKTGGHFCIEVYYKGAWHFIDADMEPDFALLDAYNMPSIAFLAARPDVLQQAYKQYPKEQVLDLFSNYSYGKVNAPAAPRAYPFQKVTQFLSYTLWSFFLLAFIWVRKKYLRLSHQPYVRHCRVHLP